MSAAAIRYRDFEIEENWLGVWEWTHVDYDIDDNRHGIAKTLDEAIADVDEWHDLAEDRP